MGPSSKLKDSRAIRFPCDGILLQYINCISSSKRSNGTSSQTASSVSEEEEGVARAAEDDDDTDDDDDNNDNDDRTKSAFQFLQRIGYSTFGEQQGHEATNVLLKCGSATTSPCTMLMTSLMTASTVQDQMNALRRFREQHLLQGRPAGSLTPAPREQQSMTTVRDNSLAIHECNDESVELTLLWEMLAEWSFSDGVLVPLRRALQKTLDLVLISASPNNHTTEQSSLLLASTTTYRIVTSLHGSTNAWKNPQSTLQEVLKYSTTYHVVLQSNELQKQVWQLLVLWSEPVHDVLRQQKCHSLPLDTTQGAAVFDSMLLESIESGVRISELCNVLLQGNEFQANSFQREVSQLRLVLWTLLQCPAVPSDHFLPLGLASSRLEVCGAVADAEPTMSGELGDGISETLGVFQKARQLLSGMPLASFLHGMASIVKLEELYGSAGHGVVENIDTCLAMLLMSSFSDLAEAADLEVRFIALKGIRSLISRCNTHVAQISSVSTAHGTSNLSEPPPSELLSTDLLPSLVEQVLHVVMKAWEHPPSRKIETVIPPLFREMLALRRKMPASQLPELIPCILAWPSNQKGRYLALEALLPEMSAETLLSKDLLDGLLSGVGDSGHNTVVIADLWAKILRQALQETCMQYRGASVDLRDGFSVTVGQPSPMTEASTSNTVTPSKKPSLPIFSLDSYNCVWRKWADMWIPSLGQALLSMERSRRKQVAAFCLPRIVSIIFGMKLRCEAAKAYALIFEEIESQTQVYHSNTDDDFGDRALWAQIHTTTIAYNQGLMDSAKTNDQARALANVIVRLLPCEKFRSALVHHAASIRMVAFEGIEAFTKSHCTGTHLQLQLETDLWSFALPYAQKCGENEYVTTTMNRLLSLLDRLSCHDSSECDDPKPSLLLPFAFFLIDDVVVKKGTYPGSTLDKETFALVLVECLLVFVAREKKLALSSRVIPKTGGLFQRRRSCQEDELVHEILRRLTSRVVFGSFTVLLHSPWDATRSTAYLLLTSMIELGQTLLPLELKNSTVRRGMEARSFFLASSPRQREADAGSRLLAILFVSSECRMDLFRCALDCLQQRLNSMEDILYSLRRARIKLIECGELPLAHGLVHSLRLMLEHLEPTTGLVDYASELQRYVKLLGKASTLSLSVIADSPVGERSLSDVSMSDSEDLVGFAVNAGAIGANGIYSSISRASETEQQLLMASQRIVVGTWLLTKETCNALAAVVSHNDAVASAPCLDEAGGLLMCTLVSIKHSGAAFGSHRALQRISEYCIKHKDPLIRQLPAKWMTQLVDEIRGIRCTTRNSSLRRSTGYALGLLAIMRSEVSSRVSPRPLCRHVLSVLLELSLPPKGQLSAILHSLGLKNLEVFSFLFKGTYNEKVDAGHHRVTARVHALNVLRAVFLDAPLSVEVFPCAGDAIASAILGFVDSDWAIRNSATMVFSSVLLRVVDADKNATNSGETSRKAMSLMELHRSYPKLLSFLRVFLDGAERLQGHRPQSLPPTFPIFLLFSRVQPVGFSGSEVATLLEPFWELLLASLGHANRLVRNIAARALVNLCFTRKAPKYSSSQLLDHCLATLRTGSDWNLNHGTLVVVRNLLQERRIILEVTTLTPLVEWLEHRFGLAIEEQSCYPPACMAISLEILELTDSIAVGEIAFQLLRCMEAGKFRTFEMSELGTAVGTIATKKLCTSIWDVNTPFELLRRDLERQALLMKTTFFDTRQAAVKAFKKTIYCGLDRLIERCDGSASKLVILQWLVAMLSSSMKCEIYDDDRMGPHPPTLRRLSRCLIEALRAFTCSARSTDEMLPLETINTISKCAHACLPPHGLTKARVKTTVMGNSVELLGLLFAVGMECDSTFLVNFADSVCALSKPSEIWRLRHSAASSLLDSQVFARCDILGVCRRQLLMAAVRLSQDADDDVRKIASQALVLGRRSPNSPTRIVNATPEYILQQSIDDNSLVEIALHSANEYSKGLEEILRSVLDEFGGLSSADSRHMVNANAGRKIFEDEAPNTYMESCLIAQVALTQWVRRQSPPIRLESWDMIVAEELLCRCEVVLELLSSWYCGENSTTASTVFYDVTCDARILPLLHTLLLGCVAALWHDQQRPNNNNGPSRRSDLAHAILRGSDPHLRPIGDTISVALQLLTRDDVNPNVFAEACFLLAKK